MQRSLRNLAGDHIIPDQTSWPGGARGNDGQVISPTDFLLLVVIYTLFPPWSQSPGFDYNPAKPLRKLHFGPKTGIRTPTLPRFGPPHLMMLWSPASDSPTASHTVPLKPKNLARIGYIVSDPSLDRISSSPTETIIHNETYKYQQ